MSRPRLGFLGVGWIGRHRMQAILAGGRCDAVAVVEPEDAAAAEALKLAPGARRVETLDAMLALDPDGIVIATPSALHASQARQALAHGAAVFCQKPLGRTAGEVETVVEQACRADRLLGVDLSYRQTEGVRRIAELVRSGALGEIFAADLVFHNGYGPDKAWFYDPEASGGGCVMDLGVHLVDLALWMLDFADVVGVRSTLFAGGEPLQAGEVEDYAAATLELAGGRIVRIACSWRLQIGRDAQISAEFHGTQGGAALRNVSGSFYDFTAEHFTGTARRTLAEPPDDWGGRAAAQWASDLADGKGFEGSTSGLVETAQVLDRIYGR